MSDILCVTSRRLCREDFLVRLERIAAAGPAALILREKDLPEQDYRELGRQVLEICRRHGVPCILHAFPRVARELDHPLLHMPLSGLVAMGEGERRGFSTLGASCHSAEEVRLARELGCTYVTLGHIFPTACKAGLAPRGLEVLGEVCRGVSIPVYAIGGITPERFAPVCRAGAAGVCLMSSLMETPDPGELLSRFRREGCSEGGGTRD